LTVGKYKSNNIYKEEDIIIIVIISDNSKEEETYHLMKKDRMNPREIYLIRFFILGSSKLKVSLEQLLLHFCKLVLIVYYIIIK